MNAFVALLRAINVGGTGKLPMSDLTALCETAGFTAVKTYIASGNVVFKSSLPEAKAQAKLARALTIKLGKPAGVTLRTADELDAVIEHNPFKKAAPNQVLIVFANETLSAEAFAKVQAPGGEELKLRGKELFIYFPDGMGRSKLKVPFAKEGTGRNLNTVTKLATMVRELTK
ncbi:MAG: hypothetical protein RL701_2006 [Pseudomonadota bacterium]|jgi:uncharacterized protein (DUF1697 family)